MIELKNNADFEQCMKCSVCLDYCPMAAVNPLYPGPKQAGPDGERQRIKDPDYFDEALKYCLNCKRCEVACPSDVRIGDLILSARIKYSRHKPKLRDRMLASTDQMGKLATAFAPIANPVLRTGFVKNLMDRVLSIDKHRTFPAYSKEKFETWYHREAEALQQTFDRNVSYFHGCYVNYNNPQLGKDLIKIFNACGYGVQLLKDEKCCGVALLSNNLPKQAARQAESNLSSIREAKQNGMVVVTTSSTCTFTMRDEYPHILDLDNSDVRDSITLATRFLFNLVDEGKIKLAFRDDFNLKVAYHTPCHMAKLGWSIYSTSLLKMIPGVEFIMLDSSCCGISGTYGFKKENYQYSQAVGEPLFRQIEKLNPDVVATDCETCKWQIEMSTGLKVENPVSILAQAIDLENTIKLNQ